MSEPTPAPAHAYYKRYYSELVPDTNDWVHDQLADEACEAQARLYDEIKTSDELGNELMAERAAFAEFKKHAWDEQEKLRAELANQKAQNNHNWQFQEISEAALKRAETAEAKLAGIRAAVMEACENAEMKVLFWYPENTSSYIHPNKLGEIYKSQTTECMAAIARVFDATAPQSDESKGEK